ncbi:MAG: trk system potassium uptake protein TrkA, partial [Ascidiaceihabitans sp.]
AIRKGDEVIRPMGSTRIDEGDIVALFALAKDVPEVERLMQVSIDFF